MNSLMMAFSKITITIVKDFTEDSNLKTSVWLVSSVMGNKLDASYKSGETNAIIVPVFSSSVINTAHAPLRQQRWLFKIIPMTGCKNRFDLKETSFMCCILFKETNVFFLKKKKNHVQQKYPVWNTAVVYFLRSLTWGKKKKKKDTCLHSPVGSFRSETGWKWSLTHDEWCEREPPLTCRVLLSVSGGHPTPPPQAIPHGVWQW